MKHTTNYLRLKNIVRSNFKNVLIEPARTNGFVAVFEDDEQTRIRVVLCDGEYHNHTEIGIHLKGIEDLQNRLVDAFETAFKDGFSAIYIHQRRKLDMRESRLKCLNSWIEAFEKSNQDYNLNKLLFNPGETLNQLSDVQLEVVNALIACAFHHGAQSSREFIKSLKKSESTGA
jgi:hypothetical protein